MILACQQFRCKLFATTCWPRCNPCTSQFAPTSLRACNATAKSSTQKSLRVELELISKNGSKTQCSWSKPNKPFIDGTPAFGPLQSPLSASKFLHVQIDAFVRALNLQGLIRRGLTVPALREFIMNQGASRMVTYQEWEKLWTFNKKHIDPVCPRHTAVKTGKKVLLNLRDVSGPDYVTVPRHKKNPAAGKKTTLRAPVWFCQRLTLNIRFNKLTEILAILWHVGGSHGWSCNSDLDVSWKQICWLRSSLQPTNGMWNRMS